MKTYLLTLFLFSFTAYSQSNSGIITYKKENLKNIFTKDKEKRLGVKKYQEFSNIEKATNRAHKVLEFTLLFNKKESRFESQNFLNTPKDRFLKFSVGPEGKGVFYNTTKERLRQRDIFGEYLLISYNKLTWKLENKTKKIGNYTCFKATTIDSVKTRNGIKKYNVTAWYSPQINVSFGPIGFSGTPGLILELERNNKKYFATKIKLNTKKKVIIKKPKKGKKISEDDFRNMLISARKDYRKLR